MNSFKSSNYDKQETYQLKEGIIIIVLSVIYMKYCDTPNSLLWVILTIQGRNEPITQLKTIGRQYYSGHAMVRHRYFSNA